MHLQNEAPRIQASAKLSLPHNTPSESFDLMTRAACHLFNLPMAVISITEHDRQSFKSRVGVDHFSVPRFQAPCAEVTDTREALVVADLLDHPVYASSVLASRGVRFYAGAPLITRDGDVLGTLCVFGRQPRGASCNEMSVLQDLAGMVVCQMEDDHRKGRVDPVSGLPNRRKLFDHLAHLSRNMPGSPYLIVIVDLTTSDQLSSGVQVMGPRYVDEMVEYGARLIGEALSSGNEVYHIAPTQFVFVAPAPADVGKYLGCLGGSKRRLQEDTAVRFTTSITIGVAPVIAGGAADSDALRMAYSALSDARSDPSGIACYSSVTDQIHRRRFQLLADFGPALQRNCELRMVYQPRIHMPSGRCIGAEALLRWSHPSFGEVPPGEFMPVVEQTSLARAATLWVMDSALHRLATWHAAGLKVNLSVNISAANLEEPDFALQVQLLLTKYCLQPRYLELEITESAIMGDATIALSQLEKLSAAGLGLAIDDFGTGYSSLAYLQRLPAHVVKIDKCFIRDIDKSAREKTLVRSMIALSKDLGYRVVAEGVESAAEAETLRSLGCDEAQGYFYSRPLEANDFSLWLQERSLGQAQARRTSPRLSHRAART